MHSIESVRSIGTRVKKLSKFTFEWKLSRAIVSICKLIRAFLVFA